MKIHTYLMTLAAAGMIGIAASGVQAQPTPADSPEPAMAPAPDATLVEAPPADEAPMVVEYAAAPAIECCPISVVRETATLSAKRMYRCYGSPIRQTICVDNPADNCCKYFGVPVCVPSCCTGEPVCCGTTTGLLGRGYVTYRYPCGFEVQISFRVHGGVIVTYS